MNEPLDESLSPEGNARREAMVGPLVEVMRHTHRSRRRRRRVLAGGGTLAVLFVVLKLTLPGGMTPQNDRQVADNTGNVNSGADAVSNPRACVTEIIQTDETVRERFRAAPVRRVAMITDRMLVDDLFAVGRPAGLIRMGNEVRLTAPVTDADLGLNIEPAPEA
ncbi:MAG: hypothetical protein GY778_25665 [bacterium]|nr:hypothetical protein [bacterium]